MTEDPRNIFYQQRNGYREGGAEQKQEDTRPEEPKGKPSEKDVNDKVEELKRLAKKYEREGEGQLVKDIVENVVEQKARGNLTNQQLIAFAKRVTPLLNAEQRERLSALLEELLKV